MPYTMYTIDSHMNKWHHTKLYESDAKKKKKKKQGECISAGSGHFLQHVYYMLHGGGVLYIQSQKKKMKHAKLPNIRSTLF